MSDAAGNTPPKKPIQSGGVFAALRRTKSVMNASDGELDGVVSSGERLAGWSALLIVAALAAEAILAFVPLSPFGTKITAFVTNSLIALGVFGELFFHKRSSLAQGEQMCRSNDRLAKAEEALASHRITPDQFAKIVPALSERPMEVLLSYAQGDPEARLFVEDIRKMFHAAGWRPNLQSVFSTDVMLGLKIHPREDVDADATFISAAFAHGGIEVESSLKMPFLVRSNKISAVLEMLRAIGY